MSSLLRICFSFLVLIVSVPSLALPQKIDGMYVSTFGNPKDQSIIFVHGGPGFNSQDFETTTAVPLAKLGYYVVAYDERGQGRSTPVDKLEYTYKRYADDLLNIISTLSLKKPILIGHSHGGPISIKFDELHPGIAKAVILVSGPVNFWKSIEAMFQNCSARYTATNQSQLLDNLKENFNKVATANPKGSELIIEPVAILFQHGLFGCKLYSTSHPTSDEKSLRQLANKNPAPMEQNSMPGFLLNEDYIYKDNFNHVQTHKGRFFGIYGDEDGLFTEDTRNQIANAINDEGSRRFHLVHGASHAIYLDQQQEFLKIVDQIVHAL